MQLQHHPNGQQVRARTSSLGSWTGESLEWASGGFFCELPLLPVVFLMWTPASARRLKKSRGNLLPDNLGGVNDTQVIRIT